MMMNNLIDETNALNYDAADPLAPLRNHFHIPPNTTYLDGNSLGLMCREAGKTLRRAANEWRTLAINGWLDGAPPWFHLAEHLGALCAPLVGAAPPSVICTASATTNLHALLATFHTPTGTKNQILADSLNFPSDIYALKSHIKLRNLPADSLILAPPSSDGLLDESQLIGLMSEKTALVLLPSVLYRSGQLLDIPRLAAAARAHDAVIGLDCSHSVGAVPHEFDAWGVDFAFWCGYKYLNGGPGAPAFLYVNPRRFGREPLLAGWFGCQKDKQFLMDAEFHYARSAGAWQISTPHILSMAALHGALQLIADTGIDAIRRKSLQLTEYFIQLTDALLPAPAYPVRVQTPRNPDQRSGHVALDCGPRARAISLALRSQGIIPDFRPPQTIRFAPIALYNTFYDVWKTLTTLKAIFDRRDDEAFANQAPAVT